MYLREKIKAVGPQVREVDENNTPAIKVPYKCMCCGDSGLINPAHEHLKNFVDGYQEVPRFICQRIYCDEGKKYMRAYCSSNEERQAHATKTGGSPLTQEQYQSNFDLRMTAQLCEELHQLAMREWIGEVQRRWNGQEAIAHIGNWPGEK